MSPSCEYFLRTDRIGFSLWSMDDLDLALMLWGNADVTAWIGGPFDSDYVAARLGLEIETMSSSGVQYWPVFSLQDDELAGCAGLRPRDGEHVFEMGIHLLPAYWGRGFAQEAAGAVIGHAFRELGARGLFAGHHPENVASERLIKKLGFRFAGEEFYEPTGLKHPFYLLENPEINWG
jgi:ribosomal-protein-alanine N-acetyltransferase